MSTCKIAEKIWSKTRLKSQWSHTGIRDDVWEQKVQLYQKQPRNRGNIVKWWMGWQCNACAQFFNIILNLNNYSLQCLTKLFLACNLQTFFNVLLVEIWKFFLDITPWISVASCVLNFLECTTQWTRILSGVLPLRAVDAEPVAFDRHSWVVV